MKRGAHIESVSVKEALDRFVEEVEHLADKSRVVLTQSDYGPEWEDIDLVEICEDVVTAADGLVEALREQFPWLALTPRDLDEVLNALAQRRSDPAFEQLAASAKLLFEQLRAPRYAVQPDPQRFPNLWDFSQNLQITIAQLQTTSP